MIATTTKRSGKMGNIYGLRGVNLKPLYESGDDRSTAVLANSLRTIDEMHSNSSNLQLADAIIYYNLHTLQYTPFTKSLLGPEKLKQF